MVTQMDFDPSVEVRSLLASIPYLGELADSDREALAQALRVDQFPDGHVFIREGTRGDTVFLIVSGEVTVTQEQRRLNLLGRGALFGLLALIDDDPRAATCRAAGPTVVASLPRSAFALLFNGQAPIALALQRALGLQLARDARHVDELLQSSSRPAGSLAKAMK